MGYTGLPQNADHADDTAPAGLEAPPKSTDVRGGFLSAPDILEANNWFTAGDEASSGTETKE